MTLKERQPLPVDWKDGLIALGLSLLSLFLYVRTLVPGLLPGDGGEFQTLAYTMGHAHTPGYEVHILLAKLFTLLVPVGDIAYRVNLLSAVDGALTVALVFLCSRVLAADYGAVRSRWAGAVAAAALAISATFWSQAIIAEVYTPGSVFTAAILLLVLLSYESRRGGLLLAAGLLGGMAIGVHNSNSLFAPAIAVLILLCTRRTTWRADWLPAILGAGVGLALMVAAFAIVDGSSTPSSTIHSVYQPSISRWDGKPEDLNSFGGRFAFLFFARQWRSAMFSGDPKVIPDNFATFQHFFGQDFAWPIRLLIPVGLIALFVRRWKLGVFFTVAILGHAIYTLNYRIGDIYVFFISLYVYLCPLIAEGLAVLLRGLSKLPGRLPLALQPGLAVVFLILSAAPFYAQRLDALQKGELRFDFMGLMSNRELRGWRGILEDEVKHFPKNAIVLTDWGKLYGYYYAAEVEQGRNDLLFLETYPYALKQGLAESLFPFLEENIRSGRPVYSEQPLEELRQGGLNSSQTYLGTWRVFQIAIAQ